MVSERRRFPYRFHSGGNRRPAGDDLTTRILNSSMVTRRVFPGINSITIRRYFANQRRSVRSQDSRSFFQPPPMAFELAWAAANSFGGVIPVTCNNSPVHG
jgi:hypothetical protein